jgi:hypothetical protein
MTEIPTGERRCPNCSARWARSGSGWLVTDIHGRLSVYPNREEPLARCPVCGALQATGKATVVEKKTNS